MSSEKNIYVSKVQKMQGGVIATKLDPNRTGIEKEESEEKIQQLKLVIS